MRLSRYVWVLARSLPICQVTHRHFENWHRGLDIASEVLYYYKVIETINAC